MVVDSSAAALIILAVWLFNYVIPQKGIKAVSVQKSIEESIRNQNKSPEEMEQEQDSFQTTKVLMDKQGWHEKFTDKFTDTVIATDTTYTSPNLSVRLSYNQYDTGKLDMSDAGRHKKYGTEISYVLADIYVGDITCLQTAFAQNTYGVGYTEKLLDMSKRMEAVLSVNGDSYSNNRHRDNGTIIRNGVIYRSQPTDVETCVLNWDGTMDIYSPGNIDIQQLVDRGAYQSWIFGPSLLDENGRANTSFQTWDYIRESHPRTAIGYYEPGHYCLLLVDGRQDNSRGMFLEEMAQLFEKLGCKAAYNLDGGHGSGVNAGLQIARGTYFKVVDSDDWLDEHAYMIVLQKLKKYSTLEARHLISNMPDLIVTNYVYDHLEEKTYRVMGYKNVFPIQTICSWNEIKHFLPTQYLIMHALIFRTDLLRKAGIQLPEHTFYVDNLFAYQPLPNVKYIYYMDVDLYHYFLGREDQSVNENILMERIDQQIRVTELVAGCVDLGEVKEKTPKLAAYMYRNISIMMAISSIHLLLIGTEEAYEKREKLWREIKKENKGMYYRLRYTTLSGLTYLPGKLGGKITLSGYQAAKKIYQFQ